MSTNRRVGIAGTEGAHQLQRLLHVLAALERALGRGLDGGAVGHGIGERHAELDQVGAGGGQAVEDLLRRGVVGIAGGDEGDEPLAALLLERAEAAVDA